MRSETALGAIGRTPMVRLRGFEPEGGAEIWIKLEGGNPTGSYKDRMAVSVLTRAIDQDAGFAMCRRLAAEAGVFGGSSTGLNVAAAVDLARELGPGKRIVTFACDSGAKYLGGHIYG